MNGRRIPVTFDSRAPKSRSIAVVAPGWAATASRTNVAPMTTEAVPMPPQRRSTPTDGRVRRDNGTTSEHRRANGTGTVAYRRGEVIFTPGQGQHQVYIVRSGCVRIFKTLPGGRSVNLGLLGPSTVFTQEDTTEGIASGTVAEALVDSTVSVVETEALASTIVESPELAAAIVSAMTRRLTDLQTQVEHLLVRDTTVRLATTLLALAECFGRPTADGMVAIALPLTHQGLANMIGSNRVTVTRRLLELQEDGSVRSLGRNVIAVDPGKLRERARQTAGRDNEQASAAVGA